jgi:hypothetical protein
MTRVCPKINAPCWYCSNEGKGAFCNNDGRHYVSDLTECPIPGARGAPAAVMDKLTWMKVRGL